jgi:hypothetical protein
LIENVGLIIDQGPGMEDSTEVPVGGV